MKTLGKFTVHPGCTAVLPSNDCRNRQSVRMGSAPPPKRGAKSVSNPTPLARVLARLPPTICTPEPHFPSFHSPNRSMARHGSTVLNGRASYRRQISGESVEHRKVKAISESFAVALPRCATLLDSPHHAPSLQEHSGWKRTTQGMEILSHTHQRGQTLRSLTES